MEIDHIEVAEEDDSTERRTVKLRDGGELWNADPKCKHKIIQPRGGGIKCSKCGGWFCY